MSDTIISIVERGRQGQKGDKGDTGDSGTGLALPQDRTETIEGTRYSYNALVGDGLPTSQNWSVEDNSGGLVDDNGEPAYRLWDNTNNVTRLFIPLTTQNLVDLYNFGGVLSFEFRANATDVTTTSMWMGFQTTNAPDIGRDQVDPADIPNWFSQLPVGDYGAWRCYMQRTSGDEVVDSGIKFIDNPRHSPDLKFLNCASSPNYVKVSLEFVAQSPTVLATVRGDRINDFYTYEVPIYEHSNETGSSRVEFTSGSSGGTGSDIMLKNIDLNINTQDSVVELTDADFLSSDIKRIGIADGRTTVIVPNTAIANNQTVKIVAYNNVTVQRADGDTLSLLNNKYRELEITTDNPEKPIEIEISQFTFGSTSGQNFSVTDNSVKRQPRSKFDGSRFVFIGDSITEAYNMPETFSGNTGADVINGGFGGSTGMYDSRNNWNAVNGWNIVNGICSGDWSTVVGGQGAHARFPDIIEYLQAYDYSQADYIVMCWGTNEWNYARTNSNYEGYEPNTPYNPKSATASDRYPLDPNASGSRNYEGAMRYIVDNLQNAHPQIKIMFWSPLWRNNSGRDSDTFVSGNLGTMIDMRDALLKVANDYNIIVLDTYDEFGVSPQNERQYLEDDLLHPSNWGGDLLAKKIQSKLESHF